MADRNRARIVLIEDHTLIRELLAYLIKEDENLELAAGCTAIADGTEALLRESPDLAIVDWALPDGRGFDLVRNVGPKLPNIRWLFISGNEQGRMVREAINLGVQGFVMKRSHLANIRDAIRHVLAGETYYCPESSRLLVDRMVVEGEVLDQRLTPREQDVLRGFARGENPKAMAERLGISIKTVQNHLSLLKDKLSLHEPAALVRYAIKHGYGEAP